MSDAAPSKPSQPTTPEIASLLHWGTVRSITFGNERKTFHTGYVKGETLRIPASHAPNPRQREFVLTGETCPQCKINPLGAASRTKPGGGFKVSPVTHCVNMLECGYVLDAG